MESELVGYLLNTLDDSTQREVAARIETDPQMCDRLERMRQALEPLKADEEIVPPPGLIARTIGRVAEHICKPMPKAPSPSSEVIVSSAAWWRRVDVLLAACLLIAVIGLAAPMVSRSHLDRSQNVQCQDNLRTLHVALEGYHNLHGTYPNTAAEKPRDAAGMVVPILRKTGVLKPKKPLICPASNAMPTDLPLDQLRAMDVPLFQQHAPDLNPSYAYSLGFVDGGGTVKPPCRSLPGTLSLMALMSDAPLCNGEAGNSLNHAGRGQNVLFQDGHVKFVSSRFVGYDGDDIFLNKSRVVAAGIDPMDAVLGCSAAKP